MSKDAKVDRLRNVKLFSGLSDRDLAAVAEISTEVSVRAGTVLASEGHAGHEAFVIEKGEAEISVDGKVVGVIGAGEMVGEMGLIDGGKRAATIRAKTDMEVLVIEPGHFGALLDDHPSVTKALLVAVIQRLRNADRLLHQ
jgi:CRP-like cAMP-binding protein